MLLLLGDLGPWRCGTLGASLRLVRVGWWLGKEIVVAEVRPKELLSKAMLEASLSLEHSFLEASCVDMFASYCPLLVSALQCHLAKAMEGVALEGTLVLRYTIGVNLDCTVATLLVSLPLARVVAQLISCLGVSPVELHSVAVSHWVD